MQPIPETHDMQVEFISELRTMRYSCRICGRCLEDRPDGLVMIERGDSTARHRAGRLQGIESEVEQDLGSGPTRH
jgi:hypothetical protein